MVNFYVEDLEVFFPYDYVYPEQYEYMRLLKATIDASGHSVLEMPTGTGKTVALLSLITSYQMAHPEIGRLIYCTRTVPEMEKALNELKNVIDYQIFTLCSRVQEVSGNHFSCKEKNNSEKSEAESEKIDDKSKYEWCKTLLAVGLTSRRNLCIHPEISQEVNREKIDERCHSLTAPWIRKKRLIGKLSLSETEKGKASEDARNCSSASIPKHPGDIEDLGLSSINVSHSGREIPGTSRFSNVCEYYESYDTAWNSSLIPSGVYTIDDLKTYASSWGFTNSRGDRITKPFCPYYGSRRLIQVANIVVLNYQYLLDPKVSQVASMGQKNQSRLFKPSMQENKFSYNDKTVKESSIVVFDEAHNIDNVCLEAFSVNFNMMILEKARQNIIRLEKLLNEAKAVNQAKLLEEYRQLLHQYLETEQIDDASIETLASPVLPEDVKNEAIPGSIRKAEFFILFLKRLVYYLSSYIRVLSVKTEGPLSFLKKMKDETAIEVKNLQFCYGRLKSLLNALEITSIEEFSPLTLVANFFTLLGTYWEGFILITDPYPEAEGIYDPLIQLSCLDSSLAMKPILNKYRSIILTSGTISPLFLYPKLLGFRPAITQSLTMSLDRNCICPLIVSKGSDQVPLSSRFDLRCDQAVLRNYGSLLIELSKCVPDGIVCFFTSYTFMEEVVSEWYTMGVLAEVLEYKLILIETKDVIATTLALHSFRKACDSGRGAVFLSVARGKVAEGIDFDRHYGRAVVLFGIPYQYTLSRLLKARLDYMRDHYQVPENEFLTFDAMRQAAQCVGRIIRSKVDYGLMIFADCRYSRIDKRQKLPDWILRQLDPSHIALSIESALCIAKRFLLEMAQPFHNTPKSRLETASIGMLRSRCVLESSSKNPQPEDFVAKGSVTSRAFKEN